MLKERNLFDISQYKTSSKINASFCVVVGIGIIAATDS